MDLDELQQKIEAFDGLAASALWQAHQLRRRWWRAYLDPDEVAWWQGRIRGAEKRAFECQVQAAMLRAIRQLYSAQ